MKIHQRAAVMHAVAQIFEDTDPNVVFDACMTILALNDVLSGYPDYTLERGKDKLLAEIYYASTIAEVLMVRKDRIPTMAEMIDAWHCDISRKHRTRFHLMLN